jgi:hypothetical protein
MPWPNRGVAEAPTFDASMVEVSMVVTIATCQELEHEDWFVDGYSLLDVSKSVTNIGGMRK